MLTENQFWEDVVVDEPHKTQMEVPVVAFWEWLTNASQNSCRTPRSWPRDAGRIYGPQMHRNIWRFPEMWVPLSHPFIDGFSIINHPILG